MAELTLIRTAYESENMTPEEIAESQGLDITAVKAGLMQCSPKYRKECGKEDEQKDELNFSDEELQRANKAITDIAFGAEDDHLRFKAATYIRNDKKGRLEVVKNQQSSGINILVLNEKLSQVREIANNMTAGLLGSKKKEPINV